MANSKGYVVGDVIRINGVDYRIKFTQSGKQNYGDFMDICITGTSVKTLEEMNQETSKGETNMVDRCIMCNEPIPEGVQVCYRCRTRSYAMVAEMRTEDKDKHLVDLQEENENLKEEIKYTETLLECWKGCAIEMMDRFGKVMSKRK